MKYFTICLCQNHCTFKTLQHRTPSRLCVSGGKAVCDLLTATKCSRPTKSQYFILLPPNAKPAVSLTVRPLSFCNTGNTHSHKNTASWMQGCFNTTDKRSGIFMESIYAAVKWAKKTWSLHKLSQLLLYNILWFHKCFGSKCFHRKLYVQWNKINE